MKLIYIANIRLPTDMAHGIQIMNMCQAFAAAGLEVELVVPKRFNKIKADAFEYYGVKESFKITRLFCLDLLIFPLGRLSFLIQSLTFSLAAKAYLRLARRTVRGNLLYVRSYQPGLFFNDYIMEVHTLPEKAKKIDIITWQKARALIVLTNFIKEELLNYGVPEGKILVAADGADLNKFSLNIGRQAAREKVNLPKDKKIILYSGSFSFNDWFNWKGVDILIEAAKSFNDDYLFVLVGGEDREVVLMEKEHQMKNLKLISHQRQRLIPYFLKSADVLVLPNKKGSSNSEKHTSPLKLFEYMASGTPIIASNLPSLREILNDGNCLFFSPNNPDDLADKINFLFLHDDLARRISQQARLDVNQHTWDRRAGAIINFIISGKI